jgi:hypothetical protein
MPKAEESRKLSTNSPTAIPIRIATEDILVLVRGDHNGSFTQPIKDAFTGREILYSDPEAVTRMLGEDGHRRMLATFRLLENNRDSLAWATLLHLTPGIGDACFDYVYGRARVWSLRPEFFSWLTRIVSRRDLLQLPSLALGRAAKLPSRPTC